MVHISRPTQNASRVSGPGLGMNAHWRVAKIAVEMANHHFEQYAMVNDIYRKLTAEGRVTEKEARAVFVDRVAPRLLEDARQALVNMLTQPDTTVPTAMKDEIAEALILDSNLRGRRFVAEDQATVPGRLH